MSGVNGAAADNERAAESAACATGDIDGLDSQTLTDYARAVQLGYGDIGKGLSRFVHALLDEGESPSDVTYRVAAVLLRDAHTMQRELDAAAAHTTAQELVDREQRRSTRRQQADEEQAEDEERAGIRDDEAAADGAARATANEPPPLDLWADGVAGTPELPEKIAPDVIELWARDVSRRIGSDPAIGVMTALVVCAAAMDDAHRIQPRAHDDRWTESARLWSAPIIQSGGGKSPTIAAMVNPLREIDLERSRADATHMEEWERRHKAWAAVALQHAKQQAAGKDPGELACKPARPQRRRRMVEDCTIESLSEVLRDQETGVLVAVDELAGWLTSHDAYRDGSAGRDRALWIEAYEGHARLIERVKRGRVYVPAWSVSLVGGIQPGPFSRLVGRITDDGLLQRMLLYYASDGHAGVDQQADYAAEGAYRRLVARLVELPAPSGPYILAADAHPIREAVETIARDVAVLPTTPESMRGTCAKYPATYARLVLVYHVVDAVAADTTPPLIVRRETCERAARLLTDYLLPHAARCHAELDGDARSEHTRWVAGYILAHGIERITGRDIYRRRRELRGRVVREDGRRGGDLAEIARVMAPLELAGWVQPEGEGYPPTRWRVRPAVHVRFAARAAAERGRRAQQRERITEARQRLALADPEHES